MRPRFEDEACALRSDEAIVQPMVLAVWLVLLARVCVCLYAIAALPLCHMPCHVICPPLTCERVLPSSSRSVCVCVCVHFAHRRAMPELSFSDFWRDANLGRLKEVRGVRCRCMAAHSPHTIAMCLCLQYPAVRARGVPHTAPFSSPVLLLFPPLPLCPDGTEKHRC